MALIVIDPGHGGATQAGSSTPLGGRGPRGTLEKDVTLRLAERVVQRLGGTAVLTRDSDVNLSLAARAELARRMGARVFVSIHANEGAAGASGCEAWVHPQAKPSSRSLARRLHGALSPLTGPGRGVCSGPMAVLDPQRLGNADGCLVEVDHLSDRAGEARLTDHRSLEAIADALAGGLRAHLRESRYGRAVPRLTSGEYSRALDDYLRICIDDPAEEAIRINLFRRSPTFVAMAQRLDQKTVANGSALDDTIGYADVEDGRVIAGAQKGKFRIDFACGVSLGHRFIPGTDPTAATNDNVITVEERGGPNGPDRGKFIEGFVHETLHLDAFVFNRFPPVTSAFDDQLDAYFKEEIAVRKQTLAIMKEVTSGNPSALAGYVIPTPPTTRPEVERDFPSGDDRLTYLETRVLEHLVNEAITAENLTASDVQALIKQCDEEPVGDNQKDFETAMSGSLLVLDEQQKLFARPTSKALEWMMRRKAAQADWKRIFDAGTPTLAEIDATAQKHASLLFPPGIQYSET